MADEIQRIDFDNPVIKGTVNLVFSGQTTTSIDAAVDTNSTIQTAMESLSNIGSGNIAVTGDWTSGFQFTFQGALANTNVSQITTVNNTLVAADNSISVTTTTSGTVGPAGLTVGTEITHGQDATAATFTLTATGGDGTPLTGSGWTFDGVNFGPTDTPNTANWTASNGFSTGTGETIAFTATIPGSGKSLPAWDTSTLIDSDSNLITVADNSTFADGVDSVEEVETISCVYAPSSGSYNIGTGTANYNDSAATVQGLINSYLSSISSGFTVTVSGGTLDTGTDFTVTYFPAGSVSSSEYMSSGWIGNTINTLTSIGSFNQVDTISLDSNVVSGTFHINDVLGIPYNDNGTLVLEYIESYLGISGGSISVGTLSWEYTYGATGDNTSNTALLAAAVGGDVLGYGGVAGYTFMEGSGSTTADIFGNGYTGTLVNSPSWDVDGGLAFDGTNYVTTALTLPTVGAVVISYLSTDNSTDRRIIGGEDADSGNHGVGLSVDIAGNLYAIIRNNGANGDISGGSPASMARENILISWGSSGTALYRNGTSVGSSANISSISTGGISLKIGGPGTGTLGGNLKGSVFVLGVFSTASILPTHAAIASNDLDSSLTQAVTVTPSTTQDGSGSINLSPSFVLFI